MKAIKYLGFNPCDSKRQKISISINYVYLYTHGQRIKERYHSWVSVTKNTGLNKLKDVNLLADQLVTTGHPEAATIGDWKSGVNNIWEQLLETIEKRSNV